MQRIPPTESSNRRHTSIVTVTVMPLHKTIDFKLNLTDIQIKTQGGHGPGGQHQNKTDSAVRATHLPTNIQVFINGRSQINNKKKALEILNCRVSEFYQTKQDQQYKIKRKQQVKNGGRSDKIRTYNFIDSRVVDHRLNKKTSKIKQVMKGNFNYLFGNII